MSCALMNKSALLQRKRSGFLRHVWQRKPEKSETDGKMSICSDAKNSSEAGRSLFIFLGYRRRILPAGEDPLYEEEIRLTGSERASCPDLTPPPIGY